MTDQVCQDERVGVYPGSFDPPTIAHLAMAVLARRACSLDRVDVVLSRHALGKQAVDDHDFDLRLRILEASLAHASWLRAVVTEHRLIADIAEGYDVVIVGGDKWEQVCDPVFYGSDVAARDHALARLPHVAASSRPGATSFEDLPAPPAGLTRLALPPRLADVSSTLARSGRPEWMTPAARKTAVELSLWGL